MIAVPLKVLPKIQVVPTDGLYVPTEAGDACR
jgi:hypothetical protein